MITDAPLYISNQTLHTDLNNLYVRDVIQEGNKSLQQTDKSHQYIAPLCFGSSYRK